MCRVPTEYILLFCLFFQLDSRNQPPYGKIELLSAVDCPVTQQRRDLAFLFFADEGGERGELLVFLALPAAGKSSLGMA